jgi:hypothetical protein
MSKIEQRAWRLCHTIFTGAHTKSGGSDAGSYGYIPSKAAPLKRCRRI